MDIIYHLNAYNLWIMLCLNQDFGLCFHLLLCFMESLCYWSKRGIISQNHLRVNWRKNILHL